MQVYELDTGVGARHFYNDRDELQSAIQLIPASVRMEVEVTLVDVSLAKVDVVSLLNGQLRAVTILRKWRLSNRGRLIEETLENK